MARIDQDTLFGRVAADRLARLTPTPGAGAVEACPNAETWAAYIDGGLRADEVDVLEAHLVTCPRCRRLVAALSPVDVPAELAPAGVADSPARVLPFARTALRRVLPLAAVLVAGVTLWLVVGQQNRESPEPGMTDAERVGPLPAVAPPPTAPDTAAGGSVAQVARAAGDLRSQTLQPARPREDRIPVDEAKARRDQADSASAASADDQARLRPAEPPAVPPVAGVVAVTAAPGPTPAKRVRQEEARGNERASAEADERKDARAEAPTPVPAQSAPSPATPAAQPPAVSARTPAAAADAVAETAAGAAASVVDRAGATSGRRDAEAARERNALSVAITFSEPEGRLRWRIVDGRRIESSSDGGTTWAVRFTDPVAGLVAGSAPAIETAWAVGARGLVLRLAVPGSWTRVTRPTDQALVSVSASDALRARVTTASGAGFETTDGGATWRSAGVP